MATKFFTNEDSNTLLDKLDGVFKHNPHIARFDALIGYFRSTGYFKIHPFLKNVPKIRILVGINVDAVTADYKKKGLLLQSVGDVKKTKQDYLRSLEEEINNADYDEQIENSVFQFIQDINKGKIQIKAHPTRKLHAKIYIFRPEDFNPHSSCEVITGSSNLTKAGLGATGNTSNYEFNVSLRDYDDVKFATDEFEKLWQEAVDILPTEVEDAKDKTFLKGEFTPFDLYIKLLIEYFGKEIEFNPNNVKDLPQSFKRLTYQLDAVQQGFEILEKHNGFFLADVVGLGKTIVAIMIARQHFYFNNSREHTPQTLIITPPAMKDQWKDTLRKFGMRRQADLITNGSLHKVEHPEEHDLIIVDEAHRFRNDNTNNYENLQRICKTPSHSGKKKKVILISATPLNNRPDDIRNQVLLFQDANDGTLEINVGEFFSRVNQRYKKINKIKGAPTSQIAELYAEVRNKVIEPLTVRRTRTDLLQHDLYSKDLEKQNIVFPEISLPEKLLYPLESSLNELYDETVKLIQGGKQGLRYIRYRAIEFMKPEHAKDYDRPEFISEQLAKIMKTLLIKRLDSSFYAFHCTLERFVKGSNTMLKMIEADRIMIAPNHKVEKHLLEGNEDELLKILLQEQDTDPSIKILSRDDFEPEFIEELKRDHDILTDMEARWKEIIEREEDPKLEKLFSVLDSKLLLKSRNPEQKLVVFSESLETTDYLTKKLTDREHQNVIAVNSKNRNELQNDIRNNFDANVPIGKQSSKYNIIVTTEVLAEGVNLHRSNTILNYDTPWNSTRLMQRIGRINRIGTKAKKIYIYNFFPTEKVEGDIQLRRRALIKLQAFHSALGEDSQIYSTDEQVETFGLFDEKPQGDKSINERLQYLMEIRKFREESPDEFHRIKKLPLKIRNAVKNQERQNNTISFLRNKKHHAFYEVDPEGNLKELGFLEAAPVFKCDPTVQALPLHEKHHEQVRKALDHFVKQSEEKIITAQQSQILTSQQRQAINYIKAMLNCEHVSEEEKQVLATAIDTIKIGKFQGLPRDINKLQKQATKENIKIPDQLKFLMKIISKYTPDLKTEDDQDPRTETDQPKLADDVPKIIISQSYV